MEQFSKTLQMYKAKKKFQTCAMCEFDEKEETLSVYFDELEHNLTQNGQKQHTSEISNARKISSFCFKK